MTDPTPEYRARDPRSDALAPTGISHHHASTNPTEPRQITGLDRARAALAGAGLRVSASDLRAAFAKAHRLYPHNPSEQYVFALGFAISTITLATPDEWAQAARELREREGER